MYGDIDAMVIDGFANESRQGRRATSNVEQIAVSLPAKRFTIRAALVSRK